MPRHGISFGLDLDKAHAGVAQLVRAPDCGSGGHRFESYRQYYSIPAPSSILNPPFSIPHFPSSIRPGLCRVFSCPKPHVRHETVSFSHPILTLTLLSIRSIFAHLRS